MERRRAEIQDQIAEELEVDPKAGETAVQVMAMVAKLEGVPLTNKQKTAAATIGGAIRAYDDAYDRYDVRASKRNARVISAAVEGESDTGDEIRGPLKRAIEIAHDTMTPEALQALKDLTKAQGDSIAQRGEGIELSVIEDITRRKGGNTVLLFALEANPRMDERRRKCYLELGYLVQLIDDYIDRDADRAGNIHTLVTELAPPEVSARILRQVSEAKRAFSAEYKPGQLKDLFAYIDSQIVKAGIQTPT